MTVFLTSITCIQPPTTIFHITHRHIADAGGPVNIKSDEWTAVSNPSSGEKAGIIAAPLAGLGLGMLIGSATDRTETSTVNGLSVSMNSHRGLAIGSLVGLAAGGVGSFVLLARSNGFYIEGVRH
jgi:hypothetical protein